LTYVLRIPGATPPTVWVEVKVDAPESGQQLAH